MNVSGSVVERTSQEPGVDEGRPIYPRRGMDRDAALVAQLRRGDAAAAAALVGAYGDRVYRLPLRITGNASDAEEVVQDALWAVSRKIDTFRGAATFGSWVYRITANSAYQKLRGRTVLGEAIDELPADYRTAFLLHDVEGLSNPEIAETLHVTLAAIKSRVHQARLFLRKRLADYMGSAEAMPGAVGGSTSGAIHRPLPPLAARLPQGVDRPHRPYQPRESEHSAGEVAVESTTRQLASNEVAVTERTATHTVGAKTWPTSFP
jgi:RNA polymerase sigma-70 factor (ECF subfamily)